MMKVQWKKKMLRNTFLTPRPPAFVTGKSPFSFFLSFFLSIFITEDGATAYSRLIQDPNLAHLPVAWACGY